MTWRGATARLEPAHVTAGEVAAYLRAHPKPAATVECLIVDEREMVYVRWPNGSVRWETASGLKDRRIPVPELGTLQTRPA